MSITRIHLPSDRSNFETLVRIDGVDFRFRYLWNDRSEKWYFTIYDLSGVKIQGATKVVVNYPLTTLTISEDLFEGSLWLTDTSGSGLEAGLRELSNRCVKLYMRPATVVGNVLVFEEEILS